MNKWMIILLLSLLLISAQCNRKSPPAEKNIPDIPEVSAIEPDNLKEARQMLKHWIEYSKNILASIEALDSEDTEAFDELFKSFLSSAELFSAEEATFIENHPDFDLYNHEGLQKEWEELKRINDEIISAKSRYYPE